MAVVRWNRSSELVRAPTSLPAKQSLAFNQKVCHDKLNDANTNFKREIKTGRRISTIKPTHTYNTPSTLESGRKEKDAGAHPYKITNN